MLKLIFEAAKKKLGRLSYFELAYLFRQGQHRARNQVNVFLSGPMQKHSTMEVVLTLTTGIIYSSFCLRFSRVCDPIIQTKLSQTHCRLHVCLKVKRTCFGRG